MWKWMALLTAAALFVCCAAFAEDVAPELNGARTLIRGEFYEIDMDGDGTPESVWTRADGFDEEAVLELCVEAEKGFFTFETTILYEDGVYVADIDGDGSLEVLMSGDEISADYFTWCLKYDPEKGLTPVPFADANRGENTDGYFDCGYGRIIAIKGNTLTLLGTQDALGTWWCTREFTLRDGRFELDDDGVWHVVIDPEDSDMWEYHSLELIRDLEVTLENGGAATLSEGERLLITETDKKSYVGFQTQSGVRGTIPVELDEENGWGFLIQGVSEYEYFDYIPYSD